MKRRSARPFTVEIKHTRTSRAAPSEATTPSRAGQTLWHDVLLDVPEGPADTPSAPRVQAEPMRPEAPARRILPSLVPMFAPPSEPEMRPEPKVERLPRVRRPKAPFPKAPCPKAPSARVRVPAEVEAPVQAVATPVARSPAAEPMAAGLRTARLSRKPTALRPGERWKRRLPRALW